MRDGSGVINGFGEVWVERVRMETIQIDRLQSSLVLTVLITPCSVDGCYQARQN